MWSESRDRRKAGNKAVPGFIGERPDELSSSSAFLVPPGVCLDLDQSEFERAIRLIVLIQRKLPDLTSV